MAEIQDDKQGEARLYEYLGVKTYSLGEYDKAKEYHERALAIRKEIGDRKGEAAAYENLESVFRSLGECGKAEKYREIALAIRKDTSDREEGSSYGDLGTLFYSHGEDGKAKEDRQKEKANSEEIGDTERAVVYGNLAKVCSNGEYGKVKKYYEKGLLQEASSYRNRAIVFLSQDKYDMAREYLEKALAIRKEIGDKKEEATDYESLGAVVRALGEYRMAEKYYKHALAVRKEIDDRDGEATDYGNLGSVYGSLGEYRKGEECYVEALVIRKELGDRKGEANDYKNLGSLFRSLGESEKAIEHYEKALAIRIEIGDEEGEAADCGSLGSIFHSLGEYDKAKDYHKKALVIRRETGDRKGKASCYENLGIVFHSIGENGAAEEYHWKALAIRKELGDRKGEASSHRNLGRVFLSLGECGKAQKYQEEALAISKETSDRRGEASSYGNLGTVYQSLGDYFKAKEYLTKALAIRIEIGDREGEAADYGNLGSLFRSLGKYVKAEKYHRKALLIRKEIGDKKGEAEDYENLGSVSRSVVEYSEALEYYQRALSIRKEIGDRGGEASCYGNLGTVYSSFGQYEKAVAYHEKALAITKEIGDRKGEAKAYGNLGIVFRHLGKYLEARECHEVALVIRETGDREGEAADYGNLGTVFLSLGDYGKAKECHHKAIAICKETGNIEAELRWYQMLTHDLLLEGNVQEAFSFLFSCIYKCENLRSLQRRKDKFKISLLDEHIVPYQMLSKLLCESGSPCVAIYAAELGRARALADLMSALYGVETQISVNPKSWVGIERIISKEENCTCLYISYVNQFIFLWVLGANKSIIFRKVAVEHNLEEFLSNAALSYSPNLQVRVQVNCEDRSVPCVRGSQSTQKPPQESRPAVFRILEEEEEEDEEEPAPSLSDFYNLIIAPVAHLLHEPEVIVVPDRFLYRVPFAALRDEAGKYLSETYRIRVVPSLMTLKLIQDSPADYHSETGALIVGDPMVGLVWYKGTVHRLCPLPGARREAEMIGRILGAQPLLGEHATKKAVLQRIHSVSLIHVAAHGNVERGEIALAPLPTNDICSREEDYLLTMHEISLVQVRAKLVVLSCCHSGRGQITADGVVGIARAFLGSGARSVLVTLGAVEDKATEQLMSRFYEHLVRGETASESLRQSMEWIRASGYPDVRDWASFMLMGDDVTFDFVNAKKSRESHN